MSEGKPRKGRKPKRGLNYYASRAMSRAERLELSRAGKVAGLSDEIALLRKHLKAAMEAPASDRRARRDVRMLTEALEVLLKAVSVEHKVSPRAAEGLANQLAGTLEILGDFVLPPETKE